MLVMQEFKASPKEWSKPNEKKSMSKRPQSPISGQLQPVSPVALILLILKAHGS